MTRWETLQRQKERRKLQRQNAMIRAALAEQAQTTLKLHAALRPFATAEISKAAFDRARQVYHGAP